MKLYSIRWRDESWELTNGFEGYTGGEADGDPDDGWYLGGSGTQAWANYSDSPTQGARTGAKALFMIADDLCHLYRSVASGTSKMIEAWTYWDTADETTLRYFGFQLDEGSDTDDIVRMHNTNKPSTAITVVVDFQYNPEQYCHIYLLSRFSGSPATYTTEENIEKTAWRADKWIGLRLVFDSKGYALYSDYDDTGSWYLESQDSWDNSATMENLTVVRVGSDGNAAGGEEVIYDDISVGVPTAGAKIADIVDGQCASLGAMRVKIHDEKLTNWSTYQDYLWSPVEILNNDLTKILWEGFITRITAQYNHVVFHGQTYLNVLERVPADYNGILATGEVTNTVDDYIDDSNAAFGAALVGKFCTFTDVAGPDLETIYPSSSSNTYESDLSTGLTPTYEHGGYADMAALDGHWSSEVAHNNFGLILCFTCPNAGTSTKFKFTLQIRFRVGSTYTDQPKLQILYDPTDTAVWTDVLDPFLPDSAIQDRVEYSFTNNDLADTTAGNYFDGAGVIKIAIIAGNAVANEKIIGEFAECVNTYSTAFSASGTVYTVDAQTATRLTFTGQTPNADGVTEGDVYVVGDYLHNILEAVWEESGARIGWCSLDCETSTIIDASDFRAQYMTNIIHRYADLMGCKVWQSPIRVINIKSTFTDTGIDLTEADLVTHPFTHEGWEWSHEGRDMVQKAIVLGPGVYAKDTQAVGNCPCGNIISDTSLTSQYLAETLVKEVLSEGSSKKVLPIIRLDMDTGSYDTIEPYRTIDGTFYSAALSFTAAIIKEISYSQTRNGHLYADLIVEKV